ncbi:MAG TPA: DMT family transporter [Xanthobacteraceae bacterium]|nr:DMT family transporter [Xanthobacteraceae bacterium]
MSRPEAIAPSSACPLDLAAAALIVLLSLSWGFNQVAVKLAIADVPPLIQSTIRSCGAALIVCLWTRARGVPLGLRDGTLAPGIVAGLLFGLEFILIYRGLVWTTATRAVLFIYLAPFFVALGARWFLPGERLGPLQWFGLAISFAGVAAAIGVPRPAADRFELIGDLMMVGAAAAWAATTLVIKASALARTPPEKTLLYQLVVSAPLLGLAALLVGERVNAAPSALALGSLAYQTVWVAGITFGVWFALIVRYSASRVSAFTFLTPLFGVAAGHVVLGEPIEPAFAAAVVLVVAGLVLVNRPR